VVKRFQQGLVKPLGLQKECVIDTRITTIKMKQESSLIFLKSDGLKRRAAICPADGFDLGPVGPCPVCFLSAALSAS